MRVPRVNPLFLLLIAGAGLPNFGCVSTAGLVSSLVTVREVDITQDATPAQWGEYRYNAEYRLKVPMVLAGEERVKNFGYGRWFLPPDTHQSWPVFAELEAGRRIRIAELRRIGNKNDYELYVIGEIIGEPNAGMKGALTQISRRIIVEGTSGGSVRPDAAFLELVEE